VDESYPHLRISREEPVNERRPGTYFPSKPPADPAAFGRRLQASLEKAVEHTSQDLGGFDERRLFRFEVEKGFQPDDIRKLARAGIELVSQEDGTVVVAFASAQGQAEFEARLATLAEGGVPTNKQVFYALRGVDRWTPEDRTGWALRQEGMPEAASFILDVELWPLESRGDRNAMRQAFDAWLRERGITALDKVLQPALLLIRVRCDREKAESLLNHRDVRTVDLPPRYGLEIGLLLTDVQSIPSIPEPPEDAPGITVLDSGVATGHPLLGPAMGDDARSFIAGFPAADHTGHGTHIAGLVLYGDVEEKIRARAFVPRFRLFSGRIFDDDDRNETGFVENHIEDAVCYFKDNYGCRIFNLSFGDSRKPFRQGHVRGLAYTLDRISRELDVLFVVSTGNVPGR
jgi:hypothetical protein